MFFVLLDLSRMNLNHRYLCRSTSWRGVFRDYVVSSVLSDAQFGSQQMELGPGHGLTSDLLRPHVARLMALEIDPLLANSLAARFSGTKVTVVRGDATAMPFPRAQFSAAGRLAAHMKPGAIFVGVDSIGLNDFRMRVIHIGDTLIPVDPDSLGSRLESAGSRQTRMPFVFTGKVRLPGCRKCEIGAMT
jgi:hypothetical protein